MHSIFDGISVLEKTNSGNMNRESQRQTVQAKEALPGKVALESRADMWGKGEEQQVQGLVAAAPHMFEKSKTSVCCQRGYGWWRVQGFEANLKTF